MIVGLNGKCIDDSKAVISVYDHGFLYGIGLFETFRTYRGRPFLLDQHLARMKKGLGELGISWELKPERICSQIDELLEANELQEAYIRFTVTAGEELLGLPSGDYHKPTEIIYVKPLPSAKPDPMAEGRGLQRLRLRRNTPEGMERFKSLHYMNNILGKRELQGYPWAAGAEGLFLDAQGCIAEGLVSNLFFVRAEDGVLCTPALSAGILPGVTRAFVLELAARAGLQTEEGRYSWEQLLCAEEVFLTNSIQEIVPVTMLFDESGDSRRVGSGTGAGSITRGLYQEYGNRTIEA